MSKLCNIFLRGKFRFFNRFSVCGSYHTNFPNLFYTIKFKPISWKVFVVSPPLCFFSIPYIYRATELSPSLLSYKELHKAKN